MTPLTCSPTVHPGTSLKILNASIGQTKNSTQWEQVIGGSQSGSEILASEIYAFESNTDSEMYQQTRLYDLDEILRAMITLSDGSLILL
ncbi:15452_t:CDS:2 [Acaulospora morrowiae]|uniref:15452_t:CDS:1 n=1 Tax=Acaulospora morrowiae TaxID=94023 RepID=A0A9N9C584_9GLOM|nr:15452_t:CDS:2 [Acaulospora morrowiae]